MGKTHVSKSEHTAIIYFSGSITDDMAQVIVSACKRFGATYDGLGSNIGGILNSAYMYAPTYANVLRVCKEVKKQLRTATYSVFPTDS